MTQVPETITIDGQPIPLKTERKRRIKRVSIRILEKECAVQLTLPWRYPLETALKFLDDRKVWIANHLHLLQPAIALSANTSITAYGMPLIITHQPEIKRGVWQEGDKLFVSGFAEHIPRRVQDYLRKHMKAICHERAYNYAHTLGIEHKLQRISIRETSSRWGSCSHRGTISLCWRLIFAPKEVLDYVVAHEVAHLVEMNHSSEFWQLVSQLDVHYKTHRKWLKTKGHELWRFGR